MAFIDNKINKPNIIVSIPYDEEDILNLIEIKKKEMIKKDKEEKIKIEKEIENLFENLEKIKEEKIKKITREDGKLILACSYSLNNNYVYPTLVAMTSLVINAGNNTFYNIYLLLSPDFTEENKKILMSVEINYPEHCKIIFKKMGNEFKGKDTNNLIPTAAYYRLYLQNLFPDVDRILYMDGDTIVFQDLSELITLDMKGNYFLGFLDIKVKELSKYNLKNGIVLCSGVLLIDLNSLRKYNFTDKFNEFLEGNLGNIYQHDQTTINVVCNGKTSSLPPKYGMWDFEKISEVLFHNKRQFPWMRFNEVEYLYSFFHPAILHYVCNKPFKTKTNSSFYYKWWEYANKTNYYDDIYKYANNANFLKKNVLLLIIFMFVLIYF